MHLRDSWLPGQLTGQGNTGRRRGAIKVERTKYTKIQQHQRIHGSVRELKVADAAGQRVPEEEWCQLREGENDLKILRYHLQGHGDNP